jgi:hypothetical protein
MSKKNKDKAVEVLDWSFEENIAILPHSPENSKRRGKPFEKGEPIDLSKDDFHKIEDILEGIVSEYNTEKRKEHESYIQKFPKNKSNIDDYLIRNLKYYNRQYIVSKNENDETEVFINCFPREDAEGCRGKDWRKNILFVLDGGPAYFRLTINITTGKHHGFVVNGCA